MHAKVCEKQVCSPLQPRYSRWLFLFAHARISGIPANECTTRKKRLVAWHTSIIPNLQNSSYSVAYCFSEILILAFIRRSVKSELAEGNLSHQQEVRHNYCQGK